MMSKGELSADTASPWVLNDSRTEGSKVASRLVGRVRGKIAAVHGKHRGRDIPELHSATFRMEVTALIQAGVGSMARSDSR